MGRAFVEITVEGATRRHDLPDGCTRLGGGDAEITLPGVGSDQVHFWSDPGRVAFVGRGAPPFADGEPLGERELAAGDCLLWAGMRIAFGREAELAEIVEAPAARGPAQPDPVAVRVRAGLAVDLGHVDARVVKRLQESVIAGDFEADRAAEELLATRKIVNDDALGERAGGLLRDFLMVPLTSGARGALRATRIKAKRGVAMLVAQGAALLVYSLIIFLAMLFMRIDGKSFDGFFDALIGFFGGSGGGPGLGDS